MEMIETQDAISTPERLGILARDFQARILNYSPTGCLLETSSRMEIGTVGCLRLTIDGRELSDDIQVVRCQTIEGAGPLFQVGVRFLWTAAPGKDSLRCAFSEPAMERLARLAG